MKKVLFLVVIIAIILIGGVLIYQNLAKRGKRIVPSEKIIMPNALENKKIAMVIAFRDFRDEEYFIPKGILKKAGAEITTVSNKPGIAVGASGGDVKVDFLLENLNPADFDAVVFIGGSGCLKNLDNEKSYRIAQETVSQNKNHTSPSAQQNLDFRSAQNKVLASICISPVILAKAGVLEGKKATVWSSPMDKSGIKILEDSGAIFQSDSVVTDKRIVTANGPIAAKEFAEAIINLLKL